ncbi:MAG: SUMF1/EgtB/PvdO family nonheme iron enzyme [Thermoguttaceae bacterium]
MTSSPKNAPAEKPEPKEEADGPAKKIAPPSAEEQKRLVAAIDEIYKPGEAKDQAAKAALARKLLEEGRKSEAKRSEQFVMFRRCGEIARDVGDADLMFEAVDAMTTAGFNVQSIPLKARLLRQLVEHGSSSGTSQLSALSTFCVTFAEQAAAGDAVEEASGVLDAARKALAEPKKRAQRSYRNARTSWTHARNRAEKTALEQKGKEAETEVGTIESALSSLAECAKNLQHARREQEAVQAARERLKTEPEDPDACLAVGRWTCFHQGDWELGLKLLAKGSDGPLKSLAAEELGIKPSKAEEKVARGDAWWDLAEKATGKAKAAMRHRAGYWYQQALPDFTPGLAKAKVEDRLAQASEEPTPEGASAGIRPPLAVSPFNEKTALLHQKRWAKYLRVPVVQFNSIGMRLALIPPGEFDMGSPKELIEEELRLHGSDGWYRDHLLGEAPRHRVRITKPFYMGVTDVTQEEYERVMGRNPSRFQGDSKRPVEQVSWDDAMEFCRRLSELPGEKAAKRRYGLPTEAQWEYACRAGNPGRWCFSERSGSVPTAFEEKLLGEYAWFKANAGGQTHAVGQKRPNVWGFCDMYGNVWEWCRDWYDKGYYANSPVDDPMGPVGGAHRVIRGGGLGQPAWGCRSAHRSYNGPGPGNLGLRVSLVPADK